MLDAYALRKAAPRILFAIIGINLSIYLCLGAVDITNIVGRGLGQLLSAPFVNAGSYDFGVGAGLSPVTEAAAITGGVGIFVGSGALAALLGVGAFAAAAPVAVLFMAFLLILPILLLALAVLVTIVIRQILLIFLIIISPVAIACFVLPGTEKFFKQWWDTFLKTLMVYPIIALIFALSDVMGSLTFNAATASGGATGVVKILTGVLIIYAPLVLIPFAFKLAGGAIGRLAAVASAGAGKVSEFGPLKGRRDIAKQKMQHGMIQERASMAGRLQDVASRNPNDTRTRRFGNRLLRGVAGNVGGYNIEAQASAARAATSKELQDQTNAGRDEEVRGLTVNKRAADRTTAARMDESGNWGDLSEALVRVDNNGTRQYKTLGGGWVNEAHVDAGHKRWGRDTFAQQAALSYEMRKAASDEEVQGVSSRYAALATEEWGMSNDQAQGAFIGAGFENQNQHLEFKHTNAITGQVNYEAFVKEAYEKKGSYPLAQMSANTSNQLINAYEQFERDGNQQGMDDVRAIAETFIQRGGGGGGQQIGGGDDEPPIRTPTTQGGGGDQQPRVFASGAGHVNERIRELAVRTHALDRPPDPGREQS
jgi:hypothetical protein